MADDNRLAILIETYRDTEEGDTTDLADSVSQSPSTSQSQPKTIFMLLAECGLFVVGTILIGATLDVVTRVILGKHMSITDILLIGIGIKYIIYTIKK